MASKKRISWSNYYKGWIASIVLMGVLAFVTSLGVVYLKHQSRQTLAELQRIEKQREALQVEWSQLLLEQGAWSVDARVERIARERLNMVVPSSKEVQVIKE